MSQILSNLIQSEIKRAFGTELLDDQSIIFADAISTAIQQYLISSVLTIPLPTGPGAGPVTHIHPNIPHQLLAQ